MVDGGLFEFCIDGGLIKSGGVPYYGLLLAPPCSLGNLE